MLGSMIIIETDRIDHDRDTQIRESTKKLVIVLYLRYVDSCKGCHPMKSS